MSGHNSALSGCRVLIVEDEYFLADDLQEALRSHGADVVGPFAEFDAAYHEAARDHFDVAVVDISLHDKEAYPIADELIRQRIPFVFYTGYEGDVIPERFANVKLLKKPLEPTDLIETIARLYQAMIS